MEVLNPFSLKGSWKLFMMMQWNCPITLWLVLASSLYQMWSKYLVLECLILWKERIYHWGWVCKDDTKLAQSMWWKRPDKCREASTTMTCSTTMSRCHGMANLDSGTSVYLRSTSKHNHELCTYNWGEPKRAPHLSLLRENSCTYVCMYVCMCVCM